jgi:hypothetical protein
MDLANVEPLRRTALLVAGVADLETRLTDAILAMFCKQGLVELGQSHLALDRGDAFFAGLPGPFQGGDGAAEQEQGTGAVASPHPRRSQSACPPWRDGGRR